MAVAAGMRGGSRTGPFALLGDERLARLAAAGHERAFGVVYERHHQALYRYCRSILRDDADAQDALQSTFVAAFAALVRGRRDAPIRPWLFRIAHNEAISALRRRRPAAELSSVAEAATISVEDQVAERAELSLLLHDLRRLTERQRSALVMRELSGLSHEEIAVALDTSVGAAKQTIYEARRSLFDFAEGRAMACDEIRKTISDADGRALRGRRVRAHLRECTACAAFAAAIPARSAELSALSPALPTLAAVGVLERLVGAGAGHGAGGAAGLAAAAAGKTAGAAMTANALAGIAVVASATVGVSIGVDRLVQAGHPAAGQHRAPVAAPVTPAATSLPISGQSAPAGRRSRAENSAGRSISAGAAHRRASGTGAGRSSHTPVTAGGSSSTTSLGGAGRVAPGQPVSAGRALQRGSQAKTPPGQAKTPPGQAKTPPGQAKAPPGQTKTPPGQTKTPPGQARTPRGQAETPPGQAKAGQASTSPGGARVSTGQARTPAELAVTPPAQVAIPPGQATTPLGEAKTPPGQAKHQTATSLPNSP